MAAGELTGQVAVVTGATSGIGLATARELHTQGMRLVLSGRSAARLAPVGAELDAPMIPGDLSESATVTRLLEAAVSEYGRCDAVLNGAGTIEVGPIAAIDIDKLCAMARVNVEASYRVAYTFLQYFVDRNVGHLINVSSVLGTKVRPTAGAYAGTKHAIEALSEALRMEVAGTPVRVSCIEPDLVATHLHRDWDVHPSKSMGISEPLQPEDVARCVTFMLMQPAHVRIPRMMVLPGQHDVCDTDAAAIRAHRIGVARDPMPSPRRLHDRYRGCCTSPGNAERSHPKRKNRIKARMLVLLLGSLPLLACADELPDAIPPDFPFPEGADPRVTTMDVAGATQYVASFSHRGDAGALYEEFRQYAGSHG